MPTAWQLMYRLFLLGLIGPCLADAVTPSYDVNRTQVDANNVKVSDVNNDDATSAGGNNFTSSTLSSSSEVGQRRLLKELERRQVIKHQGSWFNIPLERSNKSLDILMYVFLRQVIELDVKRSVVQLLIGVCMDWSDVNASWKPEDYDGIQNIHLPSGSIWTPNIGIHNGYDTQKTKAADITMLTYSITTCPTFNFKIPCKINADLFPMETALCVFEIGPLYEPLINLTDPVGNWMMKVFGMDCDWNLEWKILNMCREKTIIYGAFPIIKYSLIIRRRFFSLAVVLILPSILLSTFTLVTLSLPADSTKKTSMGISVFFSCTVMLMSIVVVAPPFGKSMPLIVQFFSINIILVAISIFTTTAVHNIQARTSGRLSNRMTLYLKKLAKILFVHMPKKRRAKPRVSLPFNYGSQKNDVEKGDMTREGKSDITAFETSMLEEKKKAEVKIAMVKQAEEDTRKAEYGLLVEVVDRLLLIVFFILLVVSGTVLFTKTLGEVDLSFNTARAC